MAETREKGKPTALQTLWDFAAKFTLSLLLTSVIASVGYLYNLGVSYRSLDSHFNAAVAPFEGHTPRDLLIHINSELKHGKHASDKLNDRVTKMQDELLMLSGRCETLMGRYEQHLKQEVKK